MSRRREFSAGTELAGESEKWEEEEMKI